MIGSNGLKNGQRGCRHAEMGIYAPEDGFQDFDPAFIFGAGKDEIDRTRRRRMGIDLGHSFAARRRPDHVSEAAGRGARGENRGVAGGFVDRNHA